MKRPVVDFDHHGRVIAQDPHAEYERVRSKCPVAWADDHDGFWVITGYGPLAEAARDDARFSSAHDVDDPESPRRGILIPENIMHAGLIEMDPPEFLKYRQLIAPWFAPAAVEKYRPLIEQWTTDLIDDFIEKGEADLVDDLTSPVPSLLTMKLLGLPTEDWKFFSDIVHRSISTPASHPDFMKIRQGRVAISERLAATVAARRDEPQDDLISLMVTAELDGEPMTDAEIVANGNLIISGGVDTTTNLMSNAIHWLWQQPEERARLRREPQRLELACEEFLRYFCPVQSLARTATTETTLDGQSIGAGDRVLLAWAGANIDPEVFENPRAMDLERWPNRHTAFGLGAHRCIGSNLARAQFMIVMRQVLERLGDYTVDAERAERYESIAIVNGWKRLPVTFPAGTRSRPRQ